MLSATKTMDILACNGFVKSWKRIKTDEYGFKVSTFKIDSEKLSFVENETYGKKSFLYFICKTPIIAKELADVLRQQGGKPNLDWNGGLKTGCIEFPVSFFRGRKYWE